jgi:hypothetical protein
MTDDELFDDEPFDDEPFRALVAANPVPALQENLPGDEQLLAKLLSESLVDAPSVNRRRRRWAIAGASVSTLLLAAFAVLHYGKVDQLTVVSCYDAATGDSSVQEEIPTDDDPVAACRAFWESGRFGNGEIPPLTACVTDSGIIAVIPGNQQVCAALGYTLWSGSLTEDERNLIAFSDELSMTFLETCYSQSAAETATKALLAKYGLNDFTIATNDNWTNALPCTASEVHFESKSVTLGARPKTDNDVNPRG